MRPALGDAIYGSDLWFAHSHDQGATWRETHVGGTSDLRSASPAGKAHAKR